MTPKIKNTCLLRILGSVAHASDRRPALRPVNELVRRFYFDLFAPGVERFLRLRHQSADFRLIPRNSVTEPGAFNPFLSDLDFSLVFNEAHLASSGPAVLRTYERLAGRFMRLGELEFYTEPEWAAREEIRASDPGLISFVWNLRKLGWQMKALRDARSTYHRYKAERSIEWLLRRLSLEAPSGFLALGPTQIREMIVARGPWGGAHESWVTGNSPFLGWELERVPAAFVAVLPHGELVDPNLAGQIEALRQNPEVGRRMALVSGFELLITRSKGRIRPSEGSAFWEGYLRSGIEKHAPKDALWAQALLKDVSH